MCYTYILIYLTYSTYVYFRDWVAMNFRQRFFSAEEICKIRLRYFQ